MTGRIGVLGVAVGGLILTTAACQLYELEQSEVVSNVVQLPAVVETSLKPNIMFVVDKSLSMMEPIDASAPDCDKCGVFPYEQCPPTCATRLSELQAALSQFLAQNGDTARFGLTTYPSPGHTCEPGRVELNIVNSDDPATLTAQAQDIDALVQGLAPRGGTPTAATLQLLADYPAFHADEDRDNVIVLLTDGLPNCNPDFDAQTCTCVVTDPSTGQPVSPCSPSLNCMDDQKVVDAISALAQQNVTTVIVGFGPELAGSMARAPLNAMAEAGGFARVCSAATDCGADETCDVDAKTGAGTCSNRFYRAQDARQLSSVLQQIRAQISNPCDFRFSATPEDERSIEVYMNGERIPAGDDTWRYERQPTEGMVRFQGALCEAARAADPNKPLDVEIRLIESR